MELKIAGSGAALNVSDQAFGTAFNEPLIHQVVTAYLAGGRRGTKAQKNRSAVAGGGAKPWRQKGTGRARSGTIRSPLWRGGGVTFAARPRRFSQKLNKKMYRAAMRSIVSELARQDRLRVFEEFGVTEPKTKGLVSKLGELALESVLIVVDRADKNLYLAARNLPRVDVSEVGGLDPVSLIRFEHVLATVPAIRQLEDWLA